MDNIVISNSVELEKVKKAILEQGKDKIHVLADFDRTLTKAFVNDKKILSIISLLRDENYLSSEYSEKAKALANKYHPIEIDLSIPFEEKKKAMHDWWTSHFKLLIKSGLNKKHLEKVIENGNIQFRQGASEFIDFLNDKIEDNLKKYKENFDIILLNDTDFNYINKLVKEIVK